MLNVSVVFLGVACSAHDTVRTGLLKGVAELRPSAMFLATLVARGTLIRIVQKVRRKQIAYFVQLGPV